VEREFKLPLKYIGFNIDDKFVVGYGLDYNEKFRGIADICHIEHF
jgi:hypoxanthine phosphoribosyltransferase